MEIQEIVSRQREFFASGATKTTAFRKDALRSLRTAVARDEKKIAEALKSDFNKPEFESYATEIGLTLHEIRFIIKHLNRWTKYKKARSPLVQFPARSFIVPEPYGVALIMSPWNYPFQLCMEPLAGAIAAGNCAVIKPSAYAPNTSRVVAELIASCFPPEYVAVVEGGREQNAELLRQTFDYIFFTGSAAVGKLVMESASKNLTPVSLELGGKSPCIVEESADLKLAGRRIAFGKYINAGQTCIAPDYLLVQRSVKDVLVRHLKDAVAEFFPGENYAELPSIINMKHYERLMGLLKGEKVLLGGSGDPSTRRILPTILDDITFDSPVMQEEIFGPILPVLVFDTIGEAIQKINARPKPLSLYLFTGDKDVEEKVLSGVSFGGGCVNETMMHAATPYMGFGGVGDSGMGSYHGKRSFDTFTHYKSILKKSVLFDTSLRYHPYTPEKYAWIRRLLR